MNVDMEDVMGNLFSSKRNESFSFQDQIQPDDILWKGSEGFKLL